MIGDITARHFGEKTQKDYIRCVKNLAAFIGRRPETATAEDLRLYRGCLGGSCWRCLPPPTIGSG
jgi:integrase/recombinase XerD